MRLGSTGCAGSPGALWGARPRHCAKEVMKEGRSSKGCMAAARLHVPCCQGEGASRKGGQLRSTQPTVAGQQLVQQSTQLRCLATCSRVSAVLSAGRQAGRQAASPHVLQVAPAVQ